MYEVLHAQNPIDTFSRWIDCFENNNVDTKKISLLVLDAPSDTAFADYDVETTIGTATEFFYIVGMGNYRRGFFLNAENCKGGSSELKTALETHIDSNVMSEFSVIPEIEQSRKELKKNFFEYLCFVKKKEISLDYYTYMQEDSMNISNSRNKWSPYKRLLGINCFQRIGYDELLRREFSITEEDYIKADEYIHVMNTYEQKGENVTVLVIYYFLLKVFYLKFKDEAPVKTKMIQLIEFINGELPFYFENGMYSAFKYFENKEPAVKGFFQKIQKGTKNPLKKIEGMAWDLYYYWTMPMRLFELEETYKVELLLKTISTKDKTFVEYIKYNPVLRVVRIGDNIVPKYKYSIDDTELVEKINNKKGLRISKVSTFSGSSLRAKLEKEVLEVLNG